MKAFLPIILIATAFGSFFLYTDKVYRKVGPTPMESGIQSKKDYLALLEKQIIQTQDILKARNSLREEYNKISTEDLKNLNDLLPDHVDNVKLVLDMNGIARKHGMTLKSIKVDEGGSTSGAKDSQIGPNRKPYSEILLSFKVTASYDNFLGFINDLEKSLRLIEVSSIGFKANESGTYDYSVTIKTFWLKK